MPKRRIRVVERAEAEYGLFLLKTVGWFDSNKAHYWRESVDWDSSTFNPISLATGDRYAHETLIRTRGGRWVLHRWNWRSLRETHEYIDWERAHQWLLTCNHNGAAAEFFEDADGERGPGRPEIGPRVTIRLPQTMLDRLDEEAQAHAATRAETIRRILARSLVSGPSGNPAGHTAAD